MAILFLTQGISANMELCEQLEKISHISLSHYQIHKEYGGDYILRICSRRVIQ